MSATRAGWSPIRSSAASTSCSVVGARREDPARVGDECESVEVALASPLVQRSPMDWIPRADAKRARYEEQHGELDERALVRRGNTAYAAGSRS